MPSNDESSEPKRASNAPQPISPVSGGSNLPSHPTGFASPDWVRWRHTPDAAAWECVAVSVGIDPDAHDLSAIEQFANMSDSAARNYVDAAYRRPMAREFARRFKIVSANLKEIAGIKSAPSPGEIVTVSMRNCMQWLRHRGFETPVELATQYSAGIEGNADDAPDQLRKATAENARLRAESEALRSQLARAEANLERLRTESADTLKTRERGTLYTMIAALLKEAKIDCSRPTKAGELVADLAAQIGLTLASRTAEEHIRRIAKQQTDKG